MSSIVSRCLFAVAVAALTLAVGCADRTSVTGPSAAAPSSNAILVPVPRPDPSAYAEISAGGSFTCARRNSGTVICWGAIVDAGSHPSAVRMPLTLDTLRALSISAGSAHICAVTTASDGVCWGDGDQGQLGNNLGYGPAQPALVAGGHKFLAIGGGMMVTCGIATDGAFCWGRHPDWSTQTIDDINSPVQISASIGDYRTVTVGTEHACTTGVGSSGREVDCWGMNSAGQLAIDPTIFPHFTPYTIRSLFTTPVRRVATRDSTTCAELVSGVVQCAGVNSQGQLGNGTTGGSSFQPQTVAGGHVFHGVSVGETHVCAIDDQNRAFCWGKNSMGELGDGTLNSSNIPVAVSGALTFRAIAAGYQHTCAIGTDNGLYCWGANYYGQAGQGTTNGIAWVNPGRVHDPR